MNVVLLDKSKNNYEIAEKAQELKYYDVAISRYYYSLYQKLNYILREKYDKFEVPKGEKGSHDKTVDQLLEYVTEQCPELENQYIMDLCGFRGLKQIRNDADYKPEKIKEHKFQNDFMKPFLLCYNALDLII